MLIEIGSWLSLGYARDSLLHPILAGKIGGVFPIIVVVAMWGPFNRYRFGPRVFLIGDHENSIGAIEAATVAIGLTGFWTQLIYGLIIVTSVIMHSYLRRGLKK